MQRLDVRQSVRDAAPWIGRVYSTGMVPRRHTLTTYFLRRDGDQALITIERREELTEGTWSAPKQEEQPFAVEDKAGTLTFRPMNGPAEVMTCKRRKIAVAGPTAVRVPSPNAGECGDKGRWRPATTKKVDVLQCTDDQDSWDQVAFAAAPGVEWLFVNDDCSIQGGGWRSIPGDGSIAPVRG